MSKTTDRAVRKAKRFARRVISVYRSGLYAYPKNVQCNVCGWTGRGFLSDGWHEGVNCPNCNMSVRHRLLFAAFQNIDELSIEKLIRGKTILHFAPEERIAQDYKRQAGTYITADFLRTDCDLQVDMSDMPEVGNDKFDAVIALDVLEHVPDYQRALEEIHRVLSPGGFAILAVPQKDNLLVTYEDPSIVTEEDRVKHFGQRDHLRIFGEDFPSIIEGKGFVVSVVDESSFSEGVQKRNVLSPPAISNHPLATNHRKAFFCKKASQPSAITKRHATVQSSI